MLVASSGGGSAWRGVDSAVELIVFGSDEW